MYFVKTEDVKSGETLAVSVKDSYDKILVTAGQMLTGKVIDRLKRLGVNGIWITNAETDDFIFESIIKQELKEETVRDLKKLNIDKTLENAKSIVKQITQNLDKDYINSKSFDNYTYEHSVGVAVYSTLIGIELGLSEKQLENLAEGALLHDLGKSAISNDIIHKPDLLTDKEYEEVKKHTVIGYNMLKDNYDIPSPVKSIIYQHHENEDGTGYPMGVKRDKIYKLAKIVHIADVYDALISKRPYKEAFSPEEAIKYLKNNSGSMFNKKFVDIFISTVPAYPKGILIKLDNGEVGVVIANRKGNVLRPVIQVITTGKVVDLAENKEYRTVKII